MGKKYIIFLGSLLFIICFVSILYAESGVVLFLNNGKKYFIPSKDIDHIEFVSEKNANDNQNNSSNFHIFTNVNFNYNYHINDPDSGIKDWFDTQVGTVCLYVFNDQDEFLFQRDLINIGGENSTNRAILFTENDFKPGETYKLGAFGLGNKKGYENSLLSPGYRLINSMIPLSSKIEDLILKIDSDKDEFGNNVVNYKDYFSANESKLDTLWITQPGDLISVTIPQLNSSSDLTEDISLNINIPLMRITNSIKINLFSDSFNKDTNVEHYEFVIDFPNGNDLIGLYGDLTPNADITYYPIRKAIKANTLKAPHSIYDSEKENGGFFKYEENLDIDAGSYSLSAEFSLSRLMSNDKSVLKIINKSSGQEVVVLENLSYWLSYYFETSFNNQEFLDREYDFSIDLRMDSQDHILMFQVGCAGLGWGYRMNQITF